MIIVAADYNQECMHINVSISCFFFCLDFYNETTTKMCDEKHIFFYYISRQCIHFISSNEIVFTINYKDPPISVISKTFYSL
jgi:hypothetical protein